MRFFQPLTAAAVFVSGTQACIRLHVINHFHPLFGDGIHIQLWDNNSFYCEMDKSMKGASGDTHWKLEAELQRGEW